MNKEQSQISSYFKTQHKNAKINSVSNIIQMIETKVRNPVSSPAKILSGNPEIKECQLNNTTSKMAGSLGLDLGASLSQDKGGHTFGAKLNLNLASVRGKLDTKEDIISCEEKPRRDQEMINF